MNRQQRAMLLLGMLLMGAAMLGSANAPAREAPAAERALLTAPATRDVVDSDAQDTNRSARLQ